MTLYNLTKLSATTSFYGMADFIHTVFPPFFVLMMVAIWITVTVIGAYYGVPQAGLISSFICGVLSIPLVLAGLLSLKTAFAFWILSAILSFIIIVVRKD